jgi:hypothetical protein
MQEIALSAVRMTKRYRELRHIIAHRDPYESGRGRPCDANWTSSTGFSAKASSQATTGVKFSGPFNGET